MSSSWSVDVSRPESVISVTVVVIAPVSDCAGAPAVAGRRPAAAGAQEPAGGRQRPARGGGGFAGGTAPADGRRDNRGPRQPGTSRGVSTLPSQGFLAQSTLRVKE